MRRPTGLALFALFFPMALSGAWVQVAAGELSRPVAIWTHAVTGTLWCLAYALHLLTPQRRAQAGAKDVAPNLTPTRLAKKGDGELKEFLRTGLTPDGDVAAESMAEVVQNTTSQLTPADLDAVVAYLRSLPPLPDEAK